MTTTSRSSSPGGRCRPSIRRTSAGANVKSVQKMLGHASHLFDGALDAVAERLDAFIGAQAGTRAATPDHRLPKGL
jgi:hypothetical protein